MKNKKGKKLVVLGAMAALLTLIGVSGSQTYAKYVESAQATSQTATVAKWDYVVTMNAENLFAEAHKKDADANLSTKTDDTLTAIVLSADSGDNIVAPGVSGSMTFGVVGQSEVAAEHLITFAYTNQVKLTYETTKVYLPIKWELEKSNSGVFEKVTFASAHDMDNNVVASKTFTHDLADIAAYFVRDGYVAPNTEIEELYRLSYSWAFSTDAIHDELDTQLGELSNATPDAANVKVAFTVSAGIQQVQVNA